MTTFRLDIQSELPKAIKWTDLHTTQLAFSISQAMNASVKGLAAISGSKQKSALNAIAGSSKRFLDQPKPQTQTGFRATTATKRNLQIAILPKDKPWSRNRYLMGNVKGGQRAPKPFEVVFAANSDGSIPTGSFFTPTGAVKPDRYGNVSRANLRKIIESVDNSSGKRGSVFIGKPANSANAAGVYRRTKLGLRPLFLVQPSAPTYSARFPADRIAMGKIKTTFGLYFRDRLSRNVAAELRRGSF